MRAADRSLPRVAGPEEPFRSLVPDPLERLRPARLRDAARRLLAPQPTPHVEADHIAPIRASVAEAIDVVLDALPEGRPVSFRELTRGIAARLEIIVRFLAVLELYKQGVVDLDQPTTFGELSVRRLRSGEVLDAASIADWDAPVATPAPGGEPRS
jgi:segregation and condensation protein A